MLSYLIFYHISRLKGDVRTISTSLFKYNIAYDNI